MKKYENFSRHLAVLKKAPDEDLENEFIISGIIDKFFIQFELGWKVLKELLIYEGQSAAKNGSPRGILKMAYGCYDFIDEELWLHMLADRNNAAHNYDEKQANKLVGRILDDYLPAFENMDQRLKEQYGALLEQI